MVVGVKPESHETAPMFALRRLYYATIGRIADVKLIPHYTGFGLYDREVIEALRRIDDPYPYFRGLIADMGYAHAEVPYVQPHAQARHHQEQLLRAVRHGHAGHHQPFQGAAAPGDHGRVCPIGRQSAHRLGLPCH